MRTKLFILMFITVFLIGQVSAADLMSFDNYKRFEKLQGEKYGTVEIRDRALFGEDKRLMDFTLLENTDQCLIDCEASGTLTLYETGKPITRTQFKNIVGDNSILEYKFFIKENLSRQIDEPIYIEECTEFMNKSTSKRDSNCHNVQDGSNTVTIWEETWVQYSGKDYVAGDYEWKLEAKKDISKSLDWVVTSFGMDISEFQWWNSDWTYKREITNLTGSITTIQLNISDNFSPTNASVRFLNGAEDTELAFVIYNRTNEVANYRIKNNGEASIFVYYGNDVAVSTSNATDVYGLGLISYWTFDEGGGTLIEDLTGIANATLVDGTWVAGNLSGGIEFDGVNDFADFSDDAQIYLNFSGAMSMYTYANSSSLDIAMYAQDCGTAGNDACVAFQRGALNRISWTVFTGSSAQTTQTAVGVLDVGTWYNLLTTANLTEVGLYRDNSEIAQEATNPGIKVANGVEMTIGRRGNGFFTGIIDEIGIWDIVLTSEENEILNNQTVSYIILGAETLNDEVQAVQSIPLDNFQTSNNTVNLLCNFTSAGLTNISNVTVLVYDSGDNLDYTNTDTTPAGLTKSVNKTWTTTALADDAYLWSCSVFGDNSKFAETTNRTFTVDATLPVITITSPPSVVTSIVIGDNLSLNWTVSDANLDSCFFEYDEINTSVVCADTNYSFTTINSQQSIIFYANDTFGNLATATTSWTYSFVENNVTFNDVVFETSNQDFTLNLTTGETILSISGVMNYDSVDYLSAISCQGQTCVLSNNIDIPLVDSGDNNTNTFFWNFTIFNGTSSSNVQTSNRQQIVNKTFLEICGGANTIETLNFTAVDEINLTQLDSFDFAATFDFWIGGGTVTRNNTFSESSVEVNLCMRDELVYSVDATIDYDESGNISTYVSRFYYFDNHTINGTREDIPLYLLQSEFSTSFILKVQDQNLLPVEDALITTQRCYADEIECRTVQIALTDENGKSIGFFQTETVDYKFIITKNGEVLLETGKQKVVPETSPFTLTFNTGDDLGSPWKGSESIPLLESTLFFDEDTGIVTYVYIDTSSNFTRATLNVTRNSLSNSSATISVCNEISTLASSTLFCNVGNTTGFYTATGFITRSGTGLDDQISFQIENLSSVVGLLGLFFGWFLILVSMFMFKFNEIAGIWVTTIVITLINLSGLIKFGTVFVTSMIVLAIIITWLLER